MEKLHIEDKQMTGQEVIELIGLERAKSVNSKRENLLESESVVLDVVKAFGVDFVYFNTDENGNSFPALFLKMVKSFDEEALSIIADIHKNLELQKSIVFICLF